MSELDLQSYFAYMREMGLPSHRREFYALQTAYFVAASMGGFKGKMADLSYQAQFAPAPLETVAFERDDDWSDWADDALDNKARD